MKTSVAMMVMLMGLLPSLSSCKTACDDVSRCPAGEFCSEGFCAPGDAPSEGEGDVAGEGEGEEGEGEGDEAEGEGEGETPELCGVVGDEDGNGLADCADSGCVDSPDCAQCRTTLSFTAVGDPLPFEAAAVAFDGVDTTYFVSGDVMFRERDGFVDQQQCFPAALNCGSDCVIVLELTTVDAARAADESAAIARGVSKRTSVFGSTSIGVDVCRWGVTTTTVAAADAKFAVARQGGIVSVAESTATQLALTWEINDVAVATAQLSRAAGQPFELLRIANELHVLVGSELVPLTTVQNGEFNFSITVGTIAAVVPPLAANDRVVTLNGFPADATLSSPWLQLNGRAGAVVNRLSVGVQPPPSCAQEPRVLPLGSDLLEAVQVGTAVFALTPLELLVWSDALNAPPQRLSLPGHQRVFALESRVLVTGGDESIVLNNDLSEAYRGESVAGVVNRSGLRVVRVDGLSAAVAADGSFGAFNNDTFASSNQFPSGVIFAASSLTQQVLLTAIDLRLFRCMSGLNCESNEFRTPCSNNDDCWVGNCFNQRCTASSADEVVGLFLTPSGTAVIARRGVGGADYITLVREDGSEATVAVPGFDERKRQAFRDGVSFQVNGEGTDLIVGTRLGSFRILAFDGAAVAGAFPDGAPIAIRHLLPRNASGCLRGLSPFGTPGQVCFSANGLDISADSGDPSGVLMVGAVGEADFALYGVEGGKTRRWLVR